jgi:hypothetical protein
MPTISIILIAVACSKLIFRERCGWFIALKISYLPYPKPSPREEQEKISGSEIKVSPLLCRELK